MPPTLPAYPLSDHPK